MEFIDLMGVILNKSICRGGSIDQALLVTCQHDLTAGLLKQFTF